MMHRGEPVNTATMKAGQVVVRRASSSRVEQDATVRYVSDSFIIVKLETTNIEEICPISSQDKSPLYFYPLQLENE